MNKLVLTLIIVLAIGTIGSCLYKSPVRAGLRTRFPVLAGLRIQSPALTTQHNFAGNEVSCGCVAPEPIVPMTPKEEAVAEKAEERQDAIENKKVALRLRRFVSLGMPRTQVKQFMGEPDMNGSSVAAGHPSDDADYYADYEVAYSDRDTVTWVGSY